MKNVDNVVKFGNDNSFHRTKLQALVVHVVNI